MRTGYKRAGKRAAAVFMLIMMTAVSAVLISCGARSPRGTAPGTAEASESVTETAAAAPVTQAETAGTDDVTTAEQVTARSTTTDTEAVTAAVTETETLTETEEVTAAGEYVEYRFRNKKLLESHYNKHGREMGFASAEEYEAAASDVINSPEALFKYEAEDGDGVYYIEETNEFVILSTDGYIRTFFEPNGGKAYFDRQ